MKLGYLSTAQPRRDARSNGQVAPDRSHFAQSLGFTEFYIPDQDMRAPACQIGLELLSKLGLLAQPSPPPPARLVCCGADKQLIGNIRNGATPIGPLASAKMVRAHSRLGGVTMSVSWLNNEQIARHWQAKVIGNTHAGLPAKPKDWRIARSILVCADAAQAEDAVMASDSPCRQYYHRIAPHLSDAELDLLLDQTVIRGTVGQVAQQLRAFKAKVGDFGTLCLVDHCWPDTAMARRSIALLADLIKPAVPEKTKSTYLRMVQA